MNCDDAGLVIAPTLLPITLFKGAAFDAILTVNEINPDGSVGKLFDFTGCTNGHLIIFNPADPTGSPLDDLDQTNGRLVLGGAAGTVTFHTDQSAVRQYSWMAAQYYFQVTNPAGQDCPLLGGPFTLTWAPPLTGGVCC